MTRKSISDEDKQKVNTFLLNFISIHGDSKKVKYAIEKFIDKHPDVEIHKSFENYWISI